MTDGKEAVEAVMGLFVAGVFILLLGEGLGTELGINLTFFGGLYIVVAMLLGVAVVIGVTKSIVNEL